MNDKATPDLSKMRVRAIPKSHETVINLVKEFAPKKLLDAPSGSGVLAGRALELGIEAFCCDIDKEHFEFSGLMSFSLRDLNRDALEYLNNSFDCIICVNGLHRLSNPANAIFEFARILKPGGVMILSWPNYASTLRRLMYVFRGSLGRSVDQPTYDQNIDAPEANFRSPLSVVRILDLLAKQPVVAKRVFSNGWHIGDILALPVSLVLHMLRSITTAFGYSMANNFQAIKCTETVYVIAQKSYV